MKALTINVERAEEERFIARGIYLKNIIKRHIVHWRFAVPLLKSERQALQQKEDILVKRFRMVHYTPINAILEASREASIPLLVSGDPARPR